jgi:allantoate deiminase
VSREAARQAIEMCRRLASFSEEPGVTTRTFLSAPMREVHATLGEWMTSLGMRVGVDAAGNLRGVYPSGAGGSAGTATLFIGSHLDTVPNAGAFDGVLGVVLGVSLVAMRAGARLPFPIEVVGFSDEEGVRFGVPFIGSRAFAGTVDTALLDRRDIEGRSVRDALRDEGHDPARLGEARAREAIGYLELHIEQGPVLEALDLPIAIVDVIAGQSRMIVTFIGQAGHAGTTPMHARRDAFAGTAEWALAVERDAAQTPGLVATVGRVDIEPGAGNVIAGRCATYLDVRHADDRTRTDAASRMLGAAREIAARRGLEVEWESRLDQPAVTMDAGLVSTLERAARRAEVPARRLTSGAGHDAMIVAGRMPAAMLFVRSPGGISHHPAESVREEDVAVALTVANHFLEEISA